MKVKASPILLKELFVCADMFVPPIRLVPPGSPPGAQLMLIVMELKEYYHEKYSKIRSVQMTVQFMYYVL